MRLSIRARLALWYGTLIVVVLMAFGCGVLWLQALRGRDQFDAELVRIGATTSSVLQEELGESGDLRKAVAETRSALNVPGWTTAILDVTGRPLLSNWNGFPYADVQPSILIHEQRQALTVTDAGSAWRLLVRRYSSPAGDYVILVAGSLEPLAREQRVLVRTLMVATPLIVLCAVGICWGVASSALRPVTAMAAQAEMITARSPDRRLSIAPGTDELDQLARAFNQLLDRLGSALRTQQQFMADASHELRTPASVVRTTAEVILGRNARDEAEYRDALSIVEEQGTRLGRMVEDILVLARADAGGYPVVRGLVDVDDVAAECVRTMSVFARPRDVRLATAIQPNVTATGDDGLLRQLLTNLLKNAINYTPAGGTVTVSLDADASTATIVVTDTGCGIPPQARERVFDRFVRLDPARGSGSGAGLGLPIARWIAELHGGSLSLEENPVGGCRFIVRLPLAQERQTETVAAAQPDGSLSD